MQGKHPSLMQEQQWLSGLAVSGDAALAAMMKGSMTSEVGAVAPDQAQHRVNLVLQPDLCIEHTCFTSWQNRQLAAAKTVLQNVEMQLLL